MVVGTAIMRIGENSRNIAGLVAERLEEIIASLPTDIVIQPVLDRTGLVEATVKTVAKNLTEGALLVIVILFLLLGNFPRGADCGARHPDHDAAHQLRHAQGACRQT